MAVKSLHLVKCVFTEYVIGVIYMYIYNKVFDMEL